MKNFSEKIVLISFILIVSFLLLTLYTHITTNQNVQSASANINQENQRLAFLPLFKKIRSIIQKYSNYPSPTPISDSSSPSTECGIRSYYVDKIAGNDSNSGLKNSPWQRLQFGVAKLKPSDNLCILTGDYRDEGPITISNKRGSQLSPITIKAEGEKILIEQFKLKNSQWVEISGFTIIGKKTLLAGWKDMPEVVIDDPSIKIDPSADYALVRKPAIEKKYSTYLYFLNWEKPEYTSGVNVESSSNIFVINNDISMHTSAVFMSGQASGLVIENNKMHHTLTAISGNKTTFLGFSFKNAIVKSNHIYQSLRSAINFNEGASNNVAENNLIEYSGHSHMGTYSAGENNIFRKNTVRFGGYYTETMQFPGSSAISIHSAGKGSRVEANHISYHYDPTLRDGNGIIVDINKNGAFIANNIIYRTQGSGITITKSKNSTIVHNTVVEPGFKTPSPINGVGFRTTDRDDSNNVFANNIVYLPKLGGMSFAINYGKVNLGKQKFIDYNIFYLYPATPLAAEGRTKSDIYPDLASFQKTGFGHNSLVTDPLFFNPDLLDFHLQSSSPAIGRGTSQYIIEVDYDNKKRNMKNPTIGVYENNI